MCKLSSLETEIVCYLRSMSIRDRIGLCVLCRDRALLFSHGLFLWRSVVVARRGGCSGH